MGNNAAYSSFEYTIITIYDHGALTLPLLDALAKDYEGMDIDSGGSRDLKTKDGKTLEEVCIGLVDPEYWEWDERYNKWNEITDERWRWA